STLRTMMMSPSLLHACGSRPATIEQPDNIAIINGSFLISYSPDMEAHDVGDLIAAVTRSTVVGRTAVAGPAFVPQDDCDMLRLRGGCHALFAGAAVLAQRLIAERRGADAKRNVGGFDECHFLH